jgi:putative DNA primase/helicase
MRKQKLYEKYSRLSKKIGEYLDRSETGDAEMFVDLFSQKVVHDHSAGKWYVRDNHYWIEDRTGRVKNAVVKVAEVYKEYADALKGKNSPISAYAMARYRDLLTARRSKNVLSLASNKPSIRLTGDEWTIHPLLLPLKNGILDLTSGTLRDGKPEDYINFFLPTSWVSLEEPAPTWERFISDICDNDPEKIDFLQRLLGYAITGETREQVMPIFWGEGSNGKSALMDTLRAILGDAICFPTQADSLMAQLSNNSEGPRPFLFAMRNKRVVWASESQDGQRLNTALVKQLTGDQSITARTLYGKPITFTPSHTIFLITNSPPDLHDGSDYAMQRRLIVFPFNTRFVDNPSLPDERQRDRDLPRKLLSEAPGILAWLAKGTIAWLEQGLNVPAVCRRETENYQKSMDTVQLYIDENLVVGDGHEVTAQAFYDSYFQWCLSNQQRPLTKNVFGRKITKRYGKSQSKWTSGEAKKVYLGIGLVSANSTPYSLPIYSEK